MENLKNKNVMELITEIENKIDFLYRNNKNYNKNQYYSILDLIDIVEELKNRL